jgi:hypothetical protein
VTLAVVAGSAAPMVSIGWAAGMATSGYAFYPGSKGVRNLERDSASHSDQS